MTRESTMRDQGVHRTDEVLADQTWYCPAQVQNEPVIETLPAIELSTDEGTAQ
ncbi:hypothetical protein [Saccharopolyspora taberi]|uniref:Uncharacterized protein n=1 Tax=Saccharopolyspora taberi TaxID=60895 RepID=A0ABN3VML3_9PSEU